MQSPRAATAVRVPRQAARGLAPDAAPAAARPCTAANSLWRAASLGAVLQRKPAISEPGDPAEQEADGVAEHVMRMDEPGAISSAFPAIQRRCGACDEEADKTVRRKDQPTGSAGIAPESAEEAVHAAQQNGAPLTPESRAYFEPRFGRNFSDVRVHADPAAAGAAQVVQARAYTLGSNIVFGRGEYQPGTPRGQQLLAHELAHVVQQGGSAQKIYRTPACPSRPAAEVAQSRTPEGILASDVVFTPAAASAINQLDVVDFAVNSANLPPGTTGNIAWQRALSIMGGDPEIRIQVAGFTDCAGGEAENVTLRKDRTDTVLSAMPAHVRKKVLFAFAIPTVGFIDTNTTPEGRAHNRSVRITFASTPAKGTDSCGKLARAANIDEYIFLTRCLETHLGLTAAADAPKALSALRQVYFGSGAWSLKSQSAWDSVINKLPWNPGTDPTPLLGAPLMAALKASDVVMGIDISHVLTGLDAMMSPRFVDHLPTPGINATTVPNEEWATWAGDVGSASAEWVVDTVFTPLGTPLRQTDYFKKFAGDDDLKGNVDAFAIRAGFNPGGTPSSRLMQTLRLTGTLSEDLRQYYRLTSSALGAHRAGATKDFIEAYGGVLSGSTVTNRAALIARMRPSVSQFAHLFMVFKLFKRGFFSGSLPRPTGAPMPTELIDPAIDTMIDHFISWLEKN